MTAIRTTRWRSSGPCQQAFTSSFWLSMTRLWPVPGGLSSTGTCIICCGCGGCGLWRIPIRDMRTDWRPCRKRCGPAGGTGRRLRMLSRIGTRGSRLASGGVQESELPGSVRGSGPRAAQGAARGHLRRTGGASHRLSPGTVGRRSDDAWRRPCLPAGRVRYGYGLPGLPVLREPGPSQDPKISPVRWSKVEYLWERPQAPTCAPQATPSRSYP
jgi:hypothetical protein